ncbi:MAG: hypothetical protein J5589_06220 [Firmicutes bacterium]|nr:hypothetical protein [Bacillota bacterium]
MRAKIRKGLVLLMIMSLIICMIGCTDPAPKPSASDPSEKFESSAVSESSAVQQSSGETSDGDSSEPETQQVEHQDGDIYMSDGGEQTLYVDRLERCEDWLGKTRAEAGIPDIFTDRVRVEGTIFGFPAYGAAYYLDGKCHKVILYTSNKTVSHDDLYEILVMENGQPYESFMGAYVEALGGCVTHDYFSTGKGTIILESAEERTYCVLTFTPDQAPEHEPTAGELALKEIKEGTGWDLTLPEDDYHDLFGGKLGGSELNWYYLTFTLDSGVECEVELVDDITPEIAEEKVFAFAQYMKDQVVSENGYSMVIQEGNKTGAIWWMDFQTAWVISVDAADTENVIDYDFLRKMRRRIISAYEQPE